MSALAAVDVPRGSVRMARLDRISLDLVDVAENVRVDPGELEDLAASIREHGVLQPIRLVGPAADGRYRAVWGQRRILASRLAEQRDIPAIVETDADVDQVGAKRSIEQLVENLQRKDLNPIEEAVALRDVLAREKGLTQAALAKQLGRSAPWVANTLRLLDTDDSVQILVREGTLTASHAKAIAALDSDLQAGFAKRVVDGGWSAHEAERQAKYAQEDGKRTRANRAAAEKRVAEAIVLLEKVVQRDSATIGVADYGYGGRAVVDGLTAAGWAANGDGYQYAIVEQAGACGCKGVWRLEVPYGATQGLKLTPACNDAEHIAARRGEHDAKWARERQERDAIHAAEAAKRDKLVVAAGELLERELETPFGRRIMLAGLLGDDVEEWLVDKYAGGSDPEDLDRDDPIWPLLARIADDDLAAVLARVAVTQLLDHWRPSRGAVQALEERLPAPEPEPPAKPAKAAPKISAKALAAARADLDLDGED